MDSDLTFSLTARLSVALFSAVLASACASDVTTNESSALPGESIPALEAYIEDALDRYDVPGAAVALIADGRIVYEAGFGVRDLDDPRPVTPATLFMDASLTKPLTSLMIETLVEDGRVDWDRPVQDIVPTFRLSNPAWSSQVTLRHLISLSSGLAEVHTPLFFERYTPSELVGALETIPLIGAPGERYAYSNQGFSSGAFAATWLATERSGDDFHDDAVLHTYERLMHERVFEPLGMTNVTFDFEAASADDNRAAPHRNDPARGVIETIALDRERFVIPVAPGGGTWSDVDDIARFALSQFDGVAPDGRRIVSRAGLRNMHAPLVEIEPGKHYALGWEVEDDHLGMHSIRKTGNSLGFSTLVRLVPEAGLGVVVLANAAQADPFFDAVDQFALELMLGRPHAGDAKQLAAHEALKTMLRDAVAQLVPVTREEAEPLVGLYDHGVEVTYDERNGLVLQGEYGSVPLEWLGDSGALACGGPLTGYFLAQLEAAAGGASRIVLSTPAGDQVFALERIPQ